MSYQATVPGFVKHMGVDEETARRALEHSVHLAKQAVTEAVADTDACNPSSAPHSTRTAAGGVAVAASIGPYGAYLADGSEYRGDYDVDADVAAFHLDKARILHAAGADVLAFETIPQGSEARAIIGIMQQHLPEAPYWLSLQCCDSARVANGDDLRATARTIVQLHDSGEAGRLVGIGANCMSPADAPALASLLAACVGGRALHVLCYPNRGEVWDAATRTWGGVQPGTATTQEGEQGEWGQQGKEGEVMGKEEEEEEEEEGGDGVCEVTSPQ